MHGVKERLHTMKTPLQRLKECAQDLKRPFLKVKMRPCEVKGSAREFKQRFLGIKEVRARRSDGFGEGIEKSLRNIENTKYV